MKLKQLTESLENRYYFNEDLSKFNFTGMSSEHKSISELPDELAYELYDITKSKWFTYAFLDTNQYKSLPIAVVDHHGNQLKFKKYQVPWVVSQPVWSWISDERTPEQQTFIDNNIEEIDKAFKQYILDIGF